MQSKETNIEFLEVRNARTHNLKGVSALIPHNALTVITGVSGSGKSSFAFDTIYAEGQRRFVESLSAYARQFLERMDKPDVDEILGIAPAIAIRQKNSTKNPRSTVATQTEIYDYLRLLFARVGQTFCYECGNEVTKDSPQSAADEILAKLPDGTRFYLLFPIHVFETSSKKAPKAEQKIAVTAVLMNLLGHGFSRLYRGGETIELQRPEDYKFDDFHNTLVLVDRLKADKTARQRLVDSLEICFRETGEALVETAEKTGKQTFFFNDKFICKHDNIEYSAPEPHLFSFNSPAGACPMCQGFGNTIGIDYNLVIPNREISIKDGAVEVFNRPQYAWAKKALAAFCAQEDINVNVPFADLTPKEQRQIIEGEGRWKGIKGFFDFLETKKYKLHIRVMLAKFRGYTKCPECGGGRLRKEAQAIRVGGENLPDLIKKPISEAAKFFSKLKLDSEREKIAEKLLAEIKRRLQFLVDVGLEYLSLDRLAATLSGGEAQRIQLATNLGSLLVGALYVLDEPSIGLHPRDNTRLVKILENLRDIGNTVLVVEHDEETMRAADHILDIGLHAGELGGELIFEGNFKNLLKDDKSLTAKYLRGEAEIKIPQNRRKPNGKFLKILDARENNLKKISVDIPLGMLVCVTGVSGSGKSTLVHDILFAGLKKAANDWTGHVGQFRELIGSDEIDDVVMVDQSPIGRTPRSNPVTYIKAYDAIREIFSQTNGARAKGLQPSHFSFNVPGGRCEVCQGSGSVTVEMQFLADVELTCEDCGGKRFRTDVLDVKYKGKNIHEVLQLTVHEALAFFKETNKIASKLRSLEAVGLGYLRLGQSATTLSGGEAQRVKLASHLAQKSNNSTLFFFDEPTTGLHFDDINKLLAAFRALIAEGNSLVVIEHNLDVIKTADWIIDLGPEGGAGGGEIVAIGAPEDIAKVKKSHTGRYLKTLFA